MKPSSKPRVPQQTSDEELAALRHAAMRWNTPLSEEHAALLLQRLDIPAGVEVLDIGCGWGELLMRAVASTDRATGVGVDNDELALARGRRLAAERGLETRVRFVAQEASAWRAPADRVLCLGASHALGGTVTALESLAALVRPGGRLLFGEGFWERPPSAEAVEIFGEQTQPFKALFSRVLDRGWRVIHFSTADQREWDDFESTFRAGREQWLLANPGDPRAARMREQLDASMSDYIGVYRGVLGLAYFVLGR